MLRTAFSMRLLFVSALLFLASDVHAAALGETCAGDGECTDPGVVMSCQGDAAGGFFCCDDANQCDDGTEATGCYSCGVENSTPALDGVCRSFCTETNGCFDDTDCVTTIPCTSVVRGWAGTNNLECQRWANDGDSRCRNNAHADIAVRGCADATDLSLCSQQGSGTANTGVTIARCGSIECRRASVCEENVGLVGDNDEVSEVCHTSGQQSCTAPMVCDATGTCALRPDGADCSANTDCLNGNCDVNGKCCGSACSACESCETTTFATCEPSCPNGATQCDDPNCATNIDCSDTLVGLVGSACRAYTENNVPGRCVPGTTDCATATDLEVCAGEADEVLQQCGSTGCVKDGVCVALASRSTVPNLEALCHVDSGADSHNCNQEETCDSAGTCVARSNGDICDAANDCPSGFSCNPFVNIASTDSECCQDSLNCGECQTCATGTCANICSTPSGCEFAACPTPVPCNNRVKGWSSADEKICEYYAADRSPTCENGSGGCVTNASDLETYCEPVLAMTAATCGSASCKKPSSCSPLAPLANFDEVSEICFTSMDPMEGTCPSGHVCNSSGTCVPRENGDACSDDTQCSSNHCVDEVCCQAASCPSCQTCATGTCMFACTGGTSCASDESGPNPDGCVPPTTSPPCSNTAVGWDMSEPTACAFWQGSDQGRCLPNGGCAPANNFAVCDYLTSTTFPDRTCGHVDCRRLAVCAPGFDGSTATLSDLCLEGGEPCNSGAGQCGTGGVCLKADGESCSMDDECLNGRCRDNTCCATDCVSGCGNCSTGTCVACSGGSCNASMCPTVTIACANKIAGWNGNSCEKFDTDTNAQNCKGGLCAQATDVEFCAGTRSLAVVNPAEACPDSNCLKLGGCVVNTVAPVQWADVCDASGTSNPSCMSPNVCRGAPVADIGICKAALIANGQTCSVDADCSSGICSQDKFCCAGACGGCGTCSSGTCEPICTDPLGCDPNSGATCPDIACNNRVKDLNGNNQCEYYTADRAGLCQNGVDQCVAANDYAFCDGGDAGDEPGVAFDVECGAATCVRSGVCNRGELRSAYAALSDLCHADDSTQCEGQPTKACSSVDATCRDANGQSCSNGSQCVSGNCVQTKASPMPERVCCDTACTGECDSCVSGTCTACSTGPPAGCSTTFNSRSCTDIACTDKVYQWVGNTCNRYTADTPAKCGDNNQCVVPAALADYAYCSSANVAPIAGTTCAHADCRKACTPGSDLANFNEISETCHIDGTSQTCDGSSNKHCTTGGECKSDNGQMCGAASDCISPNCGGSPPVCCAVACSTGCFQCNDGANCQPTCSSADGCIAAPASACPDAISCENRVAGWNGAACEWYRADVAGRCSNGGDCAGSTDYEYCDDSNKGGAGYELSCGSTQCRRTGQCQLGSAPPTLITDICHVSGQRNCGAGNVCDSTGTCKKDFGQTCAADGECASGTCSRNRCCATTCGACETCNEAGACVPTCTDEDGCAPDPAFPTDCTATISCTGFLAGWAGATCERFSTNPRQLCRPSKGATEPDLCTPSDQEQFCSSPNHPVAPSTAAVSMCDTGCVNPTKCVPLEPVSTGNAPFKVCHNDGQRGCAADEFCTPEGTCNSAGGVCTSDASCSGATPHCEGATNKFCCDTDDCSHPCQQCTGGNCVFRCSDALGCTEPACTTQISCNNRVAGWNGATCERYTANEAGKCLNGGLCTVAGSRQYCDGPTSAAASCVDTACRDLSACTKGMLAPTTSDQVCYENADGGLCPTGQVCSAGGECKLDQGETCSADNECHTGFCSQGVCCAERCGADAGMNEGMTSSKERECFQCNLAGSLGLCTVNSGKACGLNPTDCDSKLAGWAGRQCRRYQDDTTGVCLASGACDALQEARCQTNNVPQVSLFSCGSTACVNTDGSACQQYDAASGKSRSTECKINVAEPGCPSIRCNEYMSGWSNNVCQIYGSASVTGQCTSTAACSPTNTPTALSAYCPSGGRAAAYDCESALCIRPDTCTANNLLNGESRSDGCFLNTAVNACTNIDCSTTVKGWNGAVCERFDAPHPGFCTSTGGCSSDTALCKDAVTAAATITGSGANTGVCPDINCIDITKCTPDDSSSNHDSRTKVCLSNRASTSCPNVSCNSQVAGVNGKSCERFTRNSNGHCDLTSNCITECTQVPSQSRQVIATCGSVECMRPGACPAGAAASAWSSVSQLCFTGSEEAGCPTGAKCDATGTCTFTDTGGDCAIDDNCVSKFCWKDPQNPTAPGKCCSEACKDDCQTCALTPTTVGQCQSRTGQECDLPPFAPTNSPLVCTDFVRGWGTIATDALTCYKYGRTRQKECNAAEQCSDSPTLCASLTTSRTRHRLACTNSQCKKDCPAFATITTVQQNDICHTNVVRSQCPDIPCTTLMSGWDGRVCNRWEEDHVGFCESGSTFSGRCSTNVNRCASQSGQAQVQHLRCGSESCARDDKCQVNTPLAAENTVPDICHTNVAISACPDIACNSLLKGWDTSNTRCLRYRQAHSGYCTADGTCDTRNTRCEENTGLAGGTGTALTFQCSAAACRRKDKCNRFDALPTARGDVCLEDAASADCTDILCTNIVKGWSGNSCRIYDRDFPGWCLEDSSCDTAPQRCGSPEAAAENIGDIQLQQCGSVECTNADECIPFSLRSTSDTRAKVCHLNTARTQCGAPHTFPCTEYITGWGTGPDARVCQKYSRSSAGYCNGSGTCIDECSAIPQQTERPHRECASLGCVKPTSCMEGARASDYPDTDSICFTDGERHGCQEGATCNELGACVFFGDGLPCEENNQCGSRNCYKESGSMGVCCNEACENECEECFTSRGTCTPRTGAQCSFDVECTDVLKGFSSSAPNRCERYETDRKGECTSAGVCGNAIELCQGRPGVTQSECRASQCTKQCTQYAPLTSADDLSETCFVNTERSECIDIDCPKFLAGWSSADGTVCEKYSSKHPGFCDSESACTQSPEQCKNDDIVPREAHIQCGEAKCVKSCEPGEPVLAFSTRADVCIVNQATAACDTLQCSTRISGWKGRTCEKYNMDAPGFCNGDARCETDFAACATKGIIGEEHVRCGSEKCTNQCEPGAAVEQFGRADVCVIDQPQEECEDIICTLFIKGWDGRRCMRYAEDNAGHCDELSRCSQDVAYCAPLSGVAIPAAECGSEECKRDGGCFPGSPVSPYAESLAGVCDLSVDNVACPALACTNRLAGWNGNVCTRYTRDTGGFCDATGTCLDDCALVPVQDVEEVVRCRSVGCIKKDECVLDSLTNSATVNRVCHVDGMQHDCPDGAVCDPDGACVFRDTADKKGDNSLCSSNDECGSGFCLTSDEGMNICCNRACDPECEQCISGVCQPKVGEPCGDDVCKVCDASGSCQAKTTLCSETDDTNEPLFACNTLAVNDENPTQCLRGRCVPCVVPDAPPEPFDPTPQPPAQLDDCINNLDCGISLEQGKCLAGKCECGDGYSGKYCTDVSCKPRAAGAVPCNADNGGGSCTGPNTCTCNSGFAEPNCEADCSGVDNCSATDGSNKRGFCISEDQCSCDPGFTGTSCQEVADVGKVCQENSMCDTGVCYKVNAEDTDGVCCATECSGECSTCAGVSLADAQLLGVDTSNSTGDANQTFGVGFCQPKLNARCGDNDSTCQICKKSESGPGGECQAHSSLCVSEGGLEGTAFGCMANQFCFNGACSACAETPVSCGATGTFDINFKTINVLLPFKVCVGSEPIDITVSAFQPESCLVTWMPNSGVGVDCQATDNELTANTNEKLMIEFSPPLKRRLVLTFINMVKGIDKGRVTITHAPVVGNADEMSPVNERKRQMTTNATTTTAAATTTTTTTAAAGSTAASTAAPTDAPMAGETQTTVVEFEDQDVELPVLDDISSLQFEALLGSFQLGSLSSVGFVTPPTTVAPTTVAAPTTTAANTTAASTAPPATSAMPIETEAPPGFLDNIGAGLRGENDTFLGIFIGFIVLVVLCLCGCCIVIFFVVKKRRHDKKLFDAYGEGKPMQSFETVTAKPSTALGEDSEDEPFGMLPPATEESLALGTVAETGEIARVGIKVEPLTDSDESE